MDERPHTTWIFGVPKNKPCIEPIFYYWRMIYLLLQPGDSPRISRDIRISSSTLTSYWNDMNAVKTSINRVVNNSNSLKAH